MIPKTKRFIRIFGEEMENTVLTWPYNVNDRKGMGITTYQFDPGMVVTADDFCAENLTIENTSGDHGQPVVKMAFNDSREAVVNLPESYALDLQTTATAYLADDEATPLKAHLRQLAAQADPVLRTFETRFPIDENPEAARLGSTVTIKLSRKSSAFQVPLSALVNRGQGYEVWVFDPKTSSVSERAINVARLTENEAVVATGLNQGEQVVSAGAHRLCGGQKINAEIN